MKILCVGIGSPHGDDQIGWRVIEWLSMRCKESDCLTFFQSSGSGTDWFNLIPGHNVVLFIDAINVDNIEKDFYQFDESTLHDLCTIPTPSSHAISLATSIKLAKQLNLLPANWKIYAIPISQASPLTPMSEMLEKKGEKLVGYLHEKIINQSLTQPAVTGDEN